MNVQCPTCGASVEFRYDDSFVRVCDHCRAAVVRGDRGVETLGHVADLTPTASPLKLFADGRYEGEGFILVGRAQYKHPAGGIWDEWYAKMDDSRWGWLAEAQGRFYLTFETLGAGDPPPWDEVFPGATVPLEDDGPNLFTVGERGVAELVAAAGEIPFRFTPGSTSAFADLADGTGRFATIDYGDAATSGGGDTGVTIYIGRQVTLAELGISGGEAQITARAAAAAGKLSCPNCAAPVELRAPDRTLRVVCGHCASLLDCEGPLAILGTLSQPRSSTGTIPLGARGTFDGVTYTLIGRLQRQAFGGGSFFWEEHLLYEPTVGFRWLVEANGHWSFVTTLPPGAVIGHDQLQIYEGTEFRLFDTNTVQVTEVWGEMYWRVQEGELADAADYVAPPAMLSRETTSDEINWSLGVYKTRDEIRAAFGLKERLPATTGVGTNQPFKHRHAPRVLGLVALAFVGITCTRVMTADKRVVLHAEMRLEAPPAEAIPPDLQGSTTIPLIVFSEPFQLEARENVELELRVDVKDSWAFIAADLVNEATGDVESFQKEVSYYSGVEGGEHWSEGSPSTTHILPAVPAGSYILRLEVQQPMFGMRDRISVRIRQDVFRWRHALYALIAFAVPGILLALWKWHFERRRWSQSDHAPAGLGGGSDD